MSCSNFYTITKAMQWVKNNTIKSMQTNSSDLKKLRQKINMSHLSHFVGFSALLLYHYIAYVATPMGLWAILFL